MANIQHSTLAHGQVHEPRWIGINGTGASGKVITNSSSTAGISEYRKLTFLDIDNKDLFFDVYEINATAAHTFYWPCAFNGTILSWVVVIEKPLVTAGNTYELRINGVQVTGTPVVFPVGGAAGDQRTANASAANTFIQGNNIQIVGTAVGNTDATVNVRSVIIVRKN
jgi:chloramphenicol 3-O-phosphotransferase